MDEIASRIAGLREALERYNYAYYVLSAPEISDKVFDEMMKELEELEKNLSSVCRSAFANPTCGKRFI